jgi:head-tail adaptor
LPTIDKKYRKNAGDLVHQITIQRKVINPPVNGIVEEVWENIYSPRCSVNNNTGKEILQQNIEIYGIESKKFTFRTHPTIEIKQKDIIIYKESRWEIISVYDFDDNGIFTVAIAKKVFQ